MQGRFFVRIGGWIGKAEGEIVLSDGAIVCEAELTLAGMPQELASNQRLENLGLEDR